MTTRDELLAMAREAGFSVMGNEFGPSDIEGTRVNLERFHALAVAPYVRDLGLCKIAFEQKIALLKQAHATLVERDADVAKYKEDAERLQEMFSLLASAWFYGGWKAETANEREMQRIMTAAGWWPIENEDELIAKIDRARSAK